MTRSTGAQHTESSATQPRFACACAAARLAARTLTQLYDACLRDTGVEAPQFALLMLLETQGRCSQAALGRRYALDKTTISRNLKVLERNGWIASVEGRDRRERQFALTAAGRRRLALAKPEWRKAQAQMRAELTAGEWDAMFRVLGTVTRAAQSAQRTVKGLAKQSSSRRAEVNSRPR